MSERPLTDRIAKSASLKWFAGIAAAVIGALIVFTLTSTASAVVSNSNRLTRAEAKAESRDASLARIESALEKLNTKIDNALISRQARRSVR